MDSREIQTCSLPNAQNAVDSQTSTETTTLTPTTSPAVQPPYNSDTETLCLMRDFVRAEKPDTMGLAEYALTLTLLIFKADDHPVSHSETELANYLGCDVKTVSRAVQTLKSKGIEWVTQTHRPGITKLTTINRGQLPMVNGALTDTPTEHAKNLVRRYMTALTKHCERKRFPRHFSERQAITAQEILNRYNGDVEGAARVLSFAMNSPRYRGAFRKDLYSLWRRWSKLEKDIINAMQQAKPQEKEQAEASGPTPSELSAAIDEQMEAT